MTTLTLVMTMSLMAIHLFAGTLRFLDVIPRSRWLSFAGGVSIGYVFMHVFPELSSGQHAVEATGIAAFVEKHVYLVALAGLVLFYALERMGVQARRREGPGLHPSSFVYWVHLGAFALYNCLIGYLLLHREKTGVRSLFTFFTAIALHLVASDYGLLEHYREHYKSMGRYILAGAVFTGWSALAVVFAFLAGGITMNVIKEELPEEGESRLLPFLLGAAGYSSLFVSEVCQPASNRMANGDRTCCPAPVGLAPRGFSFLAIRTAPE